MPTPKARAIGFNHIALEVGDLDEALEFYGSLFDLDLRGRVPGMAFIDMGDQFLALSEGRSQPPDSERHFGLVVDDREAFRRRTRGGRRRDRAQPRPRLSRSVGQPRPGRRVRRHPVLEDAGGASRHGPGSLGKSPDAIAELREKGLAD